MACLSRYSRSSAAASSERQALVGFLYVFINIAMVMGLIPVVGVPLPLIYYGGTAMLAALIGFGLLMSLSRDAKYHRFGDANRQFGTGPPTICLLASHA